MWTRDLLALRQHLYSLIHRGAAVYTNSPYGHFQFSSRHINSHIPGGKDALTQAYWSTLHLTSQLNSKLCSLFLSQPTCSTNPQPAGAVIEHNRKNAPAFISSWLGYYGPLLLGWPHNSLFSFTALGLLSLAIRADSYPINTYYIYAPTKASSPPYRPGHPVNIEKKGHSLFLFYVRMLLFLSADCQVQYEQAALQSCSPAGCVMVICSSLKRSLAICEDIVYGKARRGATLIISITQWGRHCSTMAAAARLEPHEQIGQIFRAIRSSNRMFNCRGSDGCTE